MSNDANLWQPLPTDSTEELLTPRSDAGIESAFRIADTVSGEAGRGIAWLCATDMRRLRLEEGDVVGIKGKRTTAARLQCTSEPRAEPGVLLIDEIIRSNASVEPGDIAHLARLHCRPAESVTLRVLQGAGPSERSNAATPLRRLLAKLGVRLGVRRRLIEPQAARRQLVAGVPLMPGDRVRSHLYPAAPDLVVVDARPEGAVAVDAGTVVRIAGAAGSAGTSVVGYDDIGGLGRQVARVREMIELPLRYPKIFERLGIDTPKGILLHGPPGCGKTLIAKAVANEAGCHFISINGPEVMQQGYGESEALLRKIFQEARDYPASIIFLDEIDALAPSRETVLGDVEKRVVAQLLGLLDGIRSRGQIIVIAATNLPNSIDPALRRPGRLDREIAISPPDKGGRYEILRIHTRNMPLAASVDLDRVAAVTHGFLGADLAALCREAAMLCARDVVPQLRRLDDGASMESGLAKLKVEMKHFELAKNEIELSTTRQVFAEVPGVSWADVGGLHHVKRALRKAIEWPLKYPERFEFAGTSPPRGILLTGAPGTGKTLVAKAMAAESGVNFIYVKGPELMSKWVGESEKGIREIFKKARQAAPCLVFFDEVDTVLPVRGKGEGGGNVMERVVGQFLLEMDSLEEFRGVVVLAATSRPELIDQAFFRPGRFDQVIELPLPDLAERNAILEVHCRNRPLASDVSLTAIAEAATGMTGADLEQVCRRAATLAIGESIQRQSGREFQAFAMEKRHFEATLSEIRQELRSSSKVKLELAGGLGLEPR